MNIIKSEKSNKQRLIIVKDNLNTVDWSTELIPCLKLFDRDSFRVDVIKLVYSNIDCNSSENSFFVGSNIIIKILQCFNRDTNKLEVFKLLINITDKCSIEELVDIMNIIKEDTYKIDIFDVYIKRFN